MDNQNGNEGKSAFNWELTFWLFVTVIALVALEEGLIYCINHKVV